MDKEFEINNFLTIKNFLNDYVIKTKNDEKEITKKDLFLSKIRKYIDKGIKERIVFSIIYVTFLIVSCFALFHFLNFFSKNIVNLNLSDDLIKYLTLFLSISVTFLFIICHLLFIEKFVKTINFASRKIFKQNLTKEKLVSEIFNLNLEKKEKNFLINLFKENHFKNPELTLSENGKMVLNRIEQMENDFKIFKEHQENKEKENQELNIAKRKLEIQQAVW